MTTNNSTQETNPKPTYEEDYCDQISRKAAQLAAILSASVGEGFPSFKLYSEEIQENYLWACADLAWDIKKLSQHVTDRKQ